MPYPIFLNLDDAVCLVVGAGAVGRRKINGLLAAGCGAVHVVDPAPQAFANLEVAPALTLLARAFEPADVEGKSLVFAATDSFEVNAQIAGECRTRGILCNVATSGDASSFLVPSRVDVQGIHAAVMTDGASPALSRRLRKELAGWLERDFSGMAELLSRLRPLVLSLGLPSEDNARIFRRLAHSDINAALSRRDAPGATARLAELLPEPLLPHLEELLHELV